MGQWVGGQGQVKVAKKCKNTSTCDVPPSKRQTKNKFFFSLSTRGLAESVEGLNSSVAQAAGDLWPKKCEPLYWLARSLKSSANWICQVWVPCKWRSSVKSGAWLRRFDDITGVAKTDIFR